MQYARKLDLLTRHEATLVFMSQYMWKQGSRVVSALASCARGPGFDPCRRRGKFAGPNMLSFVSFAGMT